MGRPTSSGSFLEFDVTPEVLQLAYELLEGIFSSGTCIDGITPGKD